MAKHKTFTVATKVNVYFCDPQSPWQRGNNEDINGISGFAKNASHASAFRAGVRGEQYGPDRILRFSEDY